MREAELSRAEDTSVRNIFETALGFRGGLSTISEGVRLFQWPGKVQSYLPTHTSKGTYDTLSKYVPYLNREASAPDTSYLSREAKTSHHEVPYGTSKELAYFVLCRRRPARRETLAATKNSRPGRALRASPRDARVAPKASSQSWSWFVSLLTSSNGGLAFYTST